MGKPRLAARVTVVACGFVVLLGITTAGATSAHSDTTSVRGTIAVFRMGDDSDAGDIWLMDAGGGQYRRLTRSGDIEGSFRWSPDGRMIAFESFRGPGFDTHIWVMNADGSAQRRIPNAKGGAPTWSPDGRRIAFHYGEVWSINLDGSGKRRLTRAEGGNPAWSPDGRKIAFIRQTDPDRFDSSEIFTMNADGSRERRVTRDRISSLDPAWSPDGRWIAFVRYGRGGAKNIYAIRPDGSGLHRLVRDGSEPAWSPDGRHLAWVRYPGIWVADADGSDEHRISPRPGQDPFARGRQYNPEWSPIK